MRKTCVSDQANAILRKLRYILIFTLLSPSPYAQADATKNAKSLLEKASHFPSLRLSLGGAKYVVPSAESFEFDAALGYKFFHPSLRWRINSEIGYTFHGGNNEVDGNYVFLGGGATYHYSGKLGITILSNFVIGSTSSSLGLGLRSGFRFEFYLGLAGIEICHSWRNLNNSDVHGIRVLLSFDLLVPLHALYALNLLKKL